jgi:glycine/D-amino acid oxidase-like deaminating enzyme
MWTDAYHGGVVYEDHALLDPGRYHLGLLARAEAAGVQVVANCRVTGLERGGDGVTLATARGEVKARDAVIATNGYTGPITPDQRRRVIPIGSYMIATEPLGEGVAERLMPKDRAYSDTRKVVYYYRLSPDRTSILFGGRVSAAETDPRRSGPLLLRDLVALFPELEGIRISRSWMGFVAYTFDTLMHVGSEGRLHWAMGYCGSGVGMASYLGMRLGHRVLGAPEGRTGFDDLPFPTRPFYTGRPWFLAASVAWYRWRDRLAA